MTAGDEGHVQTIAVQAFFRIAVGLGNIILCASCTSTSPDTGTGRAQTTATPPPASQAVDTGKFVRAFMDIEAAPFGPQRIEKVSVAIKAAGAIPQLASLVPHASSLQSELDIAHKAVAIAKPRSLWNSRASRKNEDRIELSRMQQDD